jgi:transposase, IS5 family
MLLQAQLERTTREDATAVKKITGVDSPKSGHMKAEGYRRRCHLKGTAGDAANAILTAVGHNLRLVLAWLRILLCLILIALRSAIVPDPELKLAS